MPTTKYARFQLKDLLTSDSTRVNVIDRLPQRVRDLLADFTYEHLFSQNGTAGTLGANLSQSVVDITTVKMVIVVNFDSTTSLRFAHDSSQAAGAVAGISPNSFIILNDVDLGTPIALSTGSGTAEYWIGILGDES